MKSYRHVVGTKQASRLALSFVSHRSLPRIIACQPALLCAILVLFGGTVSAPATEFYVAPSGTAAGSGTQLSPWDLQTALNQPAAVKPGDTIWLLGGTYRGWFTANLNGTATAPIIVRAKPGQRAIIDGNFGTASIAKNIFTVQGNYTWIWGLEIINSWVSTPPRTTSQSGSWPTDYPNGAGLVTANSGTGTKFINCLVHDCPVGICVWNGAIDTEMYGCLSWYNGWRGSDRPHGHGSYAQNALPSHKYIRENMFYDNADHGIQIYGTTSADGFEMSGCAIWNNADLFGVKSGRNLLVGTYGHTSTDQIIVSNMTYRRESGFGDRSSDVYFGYGSGETDSRIQDNYFVGPNQWGGPYTGDTITGNFLYGPATLSPASQFPNNTFTMTRPTGVKVFVRPNKYELGRANIFIYNWDLRDTASVDISGIGLAVGDAYELHNAMNYFGDVLTGTWSGAAIDIPMTGRTVAAPYGLAAPSSPFPEFGAFVIMKLGSSGPPSVSATATFVTANASTQGNWKGVYGTDGYKIVGDATSLPAYASLSVIGQADNVWAASSTDVRALQKAAAGTDRVSACSYSFTTFDLLLNVTDGQTHRVAIYFLDWVSPGGRTQTVSILDANSGAVLDSRSFSDFLAGKYLVWDIRGNVIIRFTNTNPSKNAVYSGIFFGVPAATQVITPTISPNGGTFSGSVSVTLTCVTAGASIRYTTDGLDPTTNSSLYSSPVTLTANATVKARACKAGWTDSAVASAGFTVVPASAPSVTFVATDAATQGGWKGVYGADGYQIVGDATSLPGYVSLSVTGQADNVWAASSSDARALLKAATGADRVAACSYSFTTFDLLLNISGSQAQRVAIYFLDWVSPGGRTQTVSILDASSGAVLDSRSFSDFLAGKYLVWDIRGNVIIRFTNTNPNKNAVYSGIFFGVPAVTQVATPTISPNGGTFSGSVSVTLTCVTAGASIRYTTDGLDPTANSSLYSSPVTLTANATVKARACKAGWADSAVASAGFTVVPASGPSVTFVATDAATQGGWKGVYGADGYQIVGDATSLPGYVSLSVTGQADNVWAASSSDARALLKAAAGTDRVAACSYSFTTFDLLLNISGSQAQRVAIYFLDWVSPGGRTQMVSILDASSGAVLDSRSLSDFLAGKYLVWDIRGNVIIRFTNANPNKNAVYSGIFFGVPAVTQVATPTISPNGGTFSGSVSVTLTCVTAGASLRYTTDGLDPTANSSLYSSPVTLTTNATLKARACKAGWTDSAVVSAGFTVVPASGPSVTFVATDAATQGDWKAVYGADGYKIVGDATSLPAYASLSVTGQADNVWAASSSDARALLKAAAGTDRVAACSYSFTTFDLLLNISGSQAQRVAIYFLDWVSPGGRTQMVSILDANSGAVLDSRSFSDFLAGKYLVWDIRGNVIIRFTNANPNKNAVYSGIFFGVPAATPVATPTISPNGGTFSGSVSLTLTCVTAGASLRYTTDGLDPTANSSLYSSPVTLTTNATVKARAFRAGWADSAVASAGFTITPPALASFVATDAATQGNWYGRYGGDGYLVVAHATNLAAYASLSVTGTAQTVWAASTSDGRALQKPANTNDRVAACAYSTAGSFDLELNLTDGGTHRVALYFLDWVLPATRTQTITILDAGAGTNLNVQSLSSFGGGKYLVWDLRGHVIVRVTQSAGNNAVLSGVFFQPVETAPTTTAITAQTINANTSTGPLAFTIADAETAAGSLTLSAGSSNTTLVPTSGIVFGGSDANRTVTVTPAANQSGNATVTITVSDGIATASTSFVLTVNPPLNTAPTITSIAGQTITANASAGPLAFTIGDAQTPAGSLILSASSSNTTLVPNSTVVFGGSGANRTVTVTPAANQSGTTTITLTVSDGLASASTSFLLTVTNTAPTITSIPDQTMAANSSSAPISFTIGDAQVPATSLTLSASSSSSGLVTLSGIVFGGSGANRTVTVTPAAGQYGTVRITITVNDGALSASTSFMLTVNVTPTISRIADQTITANTSAGPLSFTISDAETTASSLTLSGSSSNSTLVPNTAIVFSGNGVTRTVTVTPADGQFGSATITVTVSDGAACASASFLLTVNVAPAATFVATDTTTQGTWKDLYGTDGYQVIQDTASYPADVQVTPSNNGQLTWAASSSDGRALQKMAGSDRIAAAWTSASTFSIDLNLTDGQPHRVALYCLDWDQRNRVQRIDLVNPVSGSVLDTRTVSGFGGGVYLVWDVTGHVVIRVANTGPVNAVVSGLFLQPVPGAAGAASAMTLNSLAGQPISAGLTGGAIGAGSRGSILELTTGSWLLTADGAGFADSDSFYYDLFPATGNFLAVARIRGLSSNGVLPLAGLMIREELIPESRFAMLATTATDDHFTACFTAPGTTFQEVVLPTAYAYPDGWVSLGRSGDSITLYTSPDGVGWTRGQTVVLTQLPATVHVGLFLTSGTAGADAQAVVTDLAVTQ